MPLSRNPHCLRGVCFITRADALEHVLPALLAAGIRWVQYREKKKPKRDVYREAVALRELTHRTGACLIINDYADIALAVEADGVHLGQDDLPLAEARKIMGGRVIGISTHSLAEAVEAEKIGADYIGFGPIFETVTKEAGEPQGLGSLREVKATVRVPVIAIGGITVDTVDSVLGTGSDGVAVSSGLIGGDPAERAMRFISAFAKQTRH